MQTGRQSAKQFDDALALAMGVGLGKDIPPDATTSSVAFVAEMHWEYLLQLFRFRAEVFTQMLALGGQSPVEPARGDKRVKDEV
jgi:polyhydroxyalkanoate synthase subunit PhaC